MGTATPATGNAKEIHKGVVEGSGANISDGQNKVLGGGLIYAARTAFQIAGAAWSLRRKDPKANWPL